MKLFRSAGLLCLALSITAPAAVAQVTGVAGINDYTLNGLVPGSTSCTSLCFASPLTLTMTVQASVGSVVVIVWTDCPCRGCSIPWPPNACFPAIPLGPLPPCATTNQSVDFLPVPGCNILFQATVFANSAGVASINVSVPSIGIASSPCSVRLSTQAVVLDPCGNGGIPLGPGPFVMTQAYDVGF
jgi:hypothetical protein